MHWTNAGQGDGYGHLNNDPNQPKDIEIGNPPSGVGDIDTVIPGTPITYKGNPFTLTGKQDEQGRVLATSETGQSTWLSPGTYQQTGSGTQLTIGGERDGATTLFGSEDTPQGVPSGAELINGWAWHTFPDGTAKRFTEAEMSAAGLGGQGGTRVGARAGDPYEAALLAYKDYDSQIAAGGIVADDAAAAWQREFDTAQTNATIETNKRDIQSSLQNTATQRGQLELDVLRSSLPEGKALSLGPFGLAPQQSVNVQELLTQGLPPLAGLYGDVESGLQPISGLPDVAPQVLPDRSFLDENLPRWIQQTEAGSLGSVV